MNIVSLLIDVPGALYASIVHRKKTLPFIIFVAILVSFFVSRATAILLWGQWLFIKGYHIHHFYYGLVLICVAGWVALMNESVQVHRIAAIVYGVGIGMALDEIGLFLTCGTTVCNYLERVTYDIFVAVVLLFLAILFFNPFWQIMKIPFVRIGNRISMFFSSHKLFKISNL